LASAYFKPEPPQVPHTLELAAPRPPMPTVPVPLHFGQTRFAAMAASWRFWSSDLNNLTTLLSLFRMGAADKVGIGEALLFLDKTIIE
jgi:hypothetical protein